MKPTKWFVLLFYFLLKSESIRCTYGITSCLPMGSCNKVTVRNYTETSTSHNPLYLIGKFNFYNLAIPRPMAVEKSNVDIDNEDFDTGKKNKATYGDVTLVYNDLRKLILACADESQNTGRYKSSPLLIREKLQTSNNVAEKRCPSKIEATAKELSENCYKNPDNLSETYTQYEIGFQVIMPSLFSFFPISSDRTTSTWHPLYTICYNHATRTTIYTTHTLHGISMGTTPLRYDGNFRDLNTPNEVENEESESINTLYEKQNVVSLFNNLFGKRYNKYADNEQKYLARGHLVPDADMAFVSWKIATYFYINVVPMWQKINNGIWKSIEKKIRKLAKELQRDLTVYTGTYKILRYNDVEIFLYGANTRILPVPAYLWKVVHDKKENKAIAIVVANDPYDNIAETISSPCFTEDTQTNMCSEFNWNWGNNEHKRTIVCCEVKTLMENVPYAPQLKNTKPYYYP